MKQYKKIYVSIVSLVMVGFLVSCSSDDDSMTTLPVPKIVQSEEISDNPLTLVFSWENVPKAEKYAFRLERLNAEGAVEKKIAEGTTNELSMVIASSPTVSLDYSTKYRFSLMAVGADAKVTNSEYAFVDVVTTKGPLSLSISNMTYRYATFSVHPSNADMLYQTAYILLEKYEKYGSDEKFINEYEFGYYKVLKENMPWIPAPWYEFMKDHAQKGDYTFNSRAMQPSTQYIFYAYGFELTGDDANPVRILTPVVKKIFTTPEWKATSKTTFKLNVESQKLSGSEVDVNLKVTPSNPQEYYFPMFIPADKVSDKASLLNYAMTTIQVLEKIHSILDWSSSTAVKQGEQIISSKAVALSDNLRVKPGQPFVVAVFGIDKNGLITTEIQSLSLQAVAE